MLTKIAGIIVMFFGFLGVINPQGFKKRMRRRMNLRLKFIVYGFILIFAVLIMGSAITAEGIAAKIAGILGLIITIKIISLITTKSSEGISKWLEGKSPVFFRIWALVLLGMGLILFLS